jgi:hypothetical protein
MAVVSRTVFLGLGVPTTASSTLTIFDSGQAGELGAKRILTHPDGVNFAPITYYRNPDRTFNLDNVVLTAPTSAAVKTLGGRQVVRFEGELEDVIVTEVWEGAEGRRAAMPTSLFRQLYEYLINPPAFDAVNQTFVEYQPRDRSTKTYNVQLYQLRVGGASRKDQVFDVDDFRLPTPPEINNPLLSLDVTPDGLITRNVTVSLRVVSEVV